MKVCFTKALLTLVFVKCLGLSGYSFSQGDNLGQEIAAELAPPEYNLQDRFGVNLASGSVQISQPVLSIGGKMGLQHTASNYTGNFGEWATRSSGFKHNYKGAAYVTDLQPLDPPNGATSPTLYYKWAVTVYGGGYNASFVYDLDREQGTISYTSFRDPRETLEYIDGRGLVYIAADGTEITYALDAAFDDSTNDPRPFPYIMPMREIKYPNGFTITTSGQYNEQVWTNTGYQLSIFYEQNFTPLPPEKAATTWGIELGVSEHGFLPRSAIALNNAVESCTTRTECDALTTDWPRGSYDWPAGSPRAMYIEGSTFSITDAAGLTTIYNHFAYEKAQDRGDGTWYKGIEPETESQPRITEIIYPDGSTTEFTYENKLFDDCVSSPVSSICYEGVSAYAALTTATQGGDSLGYAFNQPYATNQSEPIGGLTAKTQSYSQEGYRTAKIISTNAAIAPKRVELWDKVVHLEAGIDAVPDYHPNRVIKVEHLLGGGVTEYTYDNRKNITLKTFKETASSTNTITMAAEYPAACTDTTRKICNKPEWTEDGNGNRTDYTYHAESGQIAKITYPANENGIRPVKRYEYTQITPTHNGPDTSPIWLLTAEKTCRNSATNADGTCSGNDETVISYEYETDNLFRIGQVVTADGEALRTCFRYDIYGNQIGVTEPKANLTSCAY